MKNNKRKRWQNKKVVLSGVLSAAMVLQPLSMVTASAANVTAPYAAGDAETGTADAKITKVDAEKEALNQKDGLTEAELAANDYILYQANCGTSDVTVTPSGTKSGLYQTDLDQAYGEDDAAGYSWGYVEDDTYSATSRGGDTTLKGSYRYQSDKIT